MSAYPAMPDQNRVSLLRYTFVTDKESICYISWTIDAYEGLGFLRTDDASEGRVSLMFTSDYRCEIEELLGAFASEGIRIELSPLEVDEVACLKR